MLLRLLSAILILAAGVASARAAESFDESICRLIEGAASANALPVELFTRLIWRESSFRPGVTSPAGAQGIAQFMPGTAAEQQLADPFDPEQAIPASAGYLKALKERFGNWGLAAAAYNAGPTRVANWLASGGYLPGETEDYVRFVTGRAAREWAPANIRLTDPPTLRESRCGTVIATIRTTTPSLIEGPYARFGVQLSGNFSKSRAIRSFERVAARFPAIVGDRSTIIIGSRMAGRGRRAYYRVRLGAATLKEANNLCNRLRQAGGACVVLRN